MLPKLLDLWGLSFLTWEMEVMFRRDPNRAAGKKK